MKLPQSIDANASGPVLSQAWDAYVDAAADFADPQASHAAGRAAQRRLETARAAVAAYLHAEPDEILFTSGGTEADARALGGVLSQSPGAHCVSSSIEHPAVSSSLDHWQQHAQARLVRVPVGRVGRVEAQAMQQAMRADTRLVTLMAASNETGVIQPVAEVAAHAHAVGACMHTDAVQAVGRMPVNVRAWDVDLLALAGHKVGAVAGIGALYVRRGVALHPHGAPAADTANVAGAASLAAALAQQPSAADLMALAARRDAFEAQLLAQLSAIEIDIEIVGATVPRLPNTSSIRLAGCDADGVLMALDLQGFAVSTGSACSSGSIEPSPVLLSMGMTPEEARQTVRFSLHLSTHEDSLRALVERLVQVVQRMRRMAT